jgi:hypothetical protein
VSPVIGLPKSLCPTGVETRSRTTFSCSFPNDVSLTTTLALAATRQPATGADAHACGTVVLVVVEVEEVVLVVVVEVVVERVVDVLVVVVVVNVVDVVVVVVFEVDVELDTVVVVAWVVEVVVLVVVEPASVVAVIEVVVATVVDVVAPIDVVVVRVVVVVDVVVVVVVVQLTPQHGSWGFCVITGAGVMDEPVSFGGEPVRHWIQLPSDAISLPAIVTAVLPAMYVLRPTGSGPWQVIWVPLGTLI